MSSDQDSKIAEIRDRVARAKEEKRVRANEQLHTQEEPHRTLYDVLQENQQRLDDEYSKRYTERNALKRLDEDEISYLEALKEKERQHEQRIQAEVEDGLEEYRK
jgi:transcription termination factor NusB